MTAKQLIKETLEKKIPRCTVDFEETLIPDRYVVVVVSPTFERLRPIDREAAVFGFLEKLPAETMTIIDRLRCQVL